MGDIVFVAVVAARFLVPLLIPRFPFPAIVAALVIDAADQTIFSALGTEPDNYQGYDKALDVYYLTIAYISTVRNWTDGPAFRVSQFLWYYRLVGVVAFELSGARALLIIFPNTFEYFFIFYEAVRIRYEPSRLTPRHVLGAALAIWVVVKLPQEWWIHIAQLDVTDVVGDNPWLYPAAAAAVAVLAAVGWARRSRIPRTDWAWSFDVDAHPTTVLGEVADPPTRAWALINHPLPEKIILVGLVSVIFSQIIPEMNTTTLQVIIGLGAVVGLNSLVSQWLIRRGTTWTSTAEQFVAMAAINVGLVVGFRILLDRSDGALEPTNTLFFLGLLTLIVTLYDRYRSLRLASPATPTAVTPIAMPGSRQR